MAITPTARSIPDRGQQAGIPGQWAETWNDSVRNLLTGNEPALLITDELVGAAISYVPLTVVKKDATTGVITPATKTSGATGILVTGVTTIAGQTTAKTGVYRGGCFNPDLLVWDASFVTLEDKRKAFEGAASPTNIVIREIRTYTEKNPFPA